MVWVWKLQDSTGAAITQAPVEELGATNEFTSQSDAETWIGEHWQPLLEAGVESVSLFEGDRAIYGPMGLAPVGGPTAPSDPAPEGASPAGS